MKLKKKISAKEWNNLEDEKLIALHDQFTQKSKSNHKLPKGSWDLITKSLGRPRNACIFRYYLLRDAFQTKKKGATRKFFMVNRTAKRVNPLSTNKEKEDEEDESEEIISKDENLEDIAPEGENEDEEDEKSEEIEFSHQELDYSSQKIEESNEEAQQFELSSSESEPEEEIEEFQVRKPAIHIEYVENEEWECTLSLLKLPVVVVNQTPNLFGYHFNPKKNIQEKLGKVFDL